MTRHDVEAFVQTLREFHTALPENHQVILETILVPVVHDQETSGYAFKIKWRPQTPISPQAAASDAEETSGYGAKWGRRPDKPISPQAIGAEGDETSGYRFRMHRRYEDENEGSEDEQGQASPELEIDWSSEAAWTRLFKTLSEIDDTQGFGIKTF